MPTLADFTRPALILPQLRGQDVAGVIQELSQVLQRAGYIPDLLPFYQAALNREFLVGTDMEPGIACPHARLPALKTLTFAFGRRDRPLVWGTRGARQVRSVFLLAVPATDSLEHLLLISGLGRLAADPALIEKLNAAPTAAHIFEVLRQVKIRTNFSRDALNGAAIT